MYENNNYFGYDMNNTNNTNNTNSTNNTHDINNNVGADSTADNKQAGSSYSMNEDGTYRGVYSNSYFDDITPRGADSNSNYSNAANGNSDNRDRSNNNTGYSTSHHTNYNTADGETTSYEASSSDKKKTGKAGSFFKKALLSISLGLFFGLFAGIGFYAVQQATGMLNQDKPLESEAVTDVISDSTVNSGVQQLTNTSNVTVVQSNVVDVAEEVMPAMVSIINKYTVTSSFWGQTYTEEAASSGSGIVVGKTDSELLIVSNNHVVEGAETLEVTFIDGAVAEARIKGLDSDMDLAVIAVALDAVSAETMDAITVATLGNSDDLKLGEPVIAIGNALGYGQSVTDGIVSALNREITMDDGSTGTFIQTNAAINPGNSGGALLNVNGEVIGINTSKIGGTAIEGMGYAIPITSASPIIADLMERQTRNKVAEGEMGYMGISLQEVTAQIAAMYNWPQGIYVLSVEEGSAAWKAGMMAGDIIVKFDGQKISSYEELQDVLQYFAAGDSTEVTVMRPENGQYVEYDLAITLGERPADR